VAVERVDATEGASPWREEHISRYLWAGAFLEGQTVLDLACGTGFGSRILLEHGAGRVVAADASSEALESAANELASFGDRAEVVRQDCLDLTFADGHFDAVVSMETIEHLDDAGRFLDEAARVLRPGGQLLLSTPNALVTNPDGGKPTNPFHVREFTPDELRRMAEQRLEVERAVGQHVPSGYGVAPFLPSFSPSRLSFSGRVNFLYWRILLRLPPLRDIIHRALTGFPFYPRDVDYTFLERDLDRAHVQVLRCIKRGPGS